MAVLVGGYDKTGANAGADMLFRGRGAPMLGADRLDDI